MQNVSNIDKKIAKKNKLIRFVKKVADTAQQTITINTKQCSTSKKKMITENKKKKIKNNF